MLMWMSMFVHFIFVDAVVAAPLEDAVDADLEADQDYLQQADRYEAQYNFRFEVCIHACTISPGSCCQSCLLPTTRQVHKSKPLTCLITCAYI
jgi:hypothetical protein